MWRSFERRGSEFIGPREFLLCVYGDTEIVLVVSNIGKVAAATTTTLLVDRFNVDAVVVTGVAGGVSDDAQVGDIVIADALVQHDLDLKGALGCARFVVPSLGVSHLATCSQLRAVGRAAAEVAIADRHYREAVRDIVAREPKLHSGVIGSGDQFINDTTQRADLVAQIPDLIAVEMEGAAVAQVCAERGVPLVVMRVISDTAQGGALRDFNLFVERAAAVASHVFVKEFVSGVAL
jgi:adenosylhomocysteine nucleosidase